MKTSSGILMMFASPRFMLAVELLIVEIVRRGRLPTVLATVADIDSAGSSVVPVAPCDELSDVPSPVVVYIYAEKPHSGFMGG